ncbi:hemagglutinin repeat-containing protein [Ralstonia solanacearum]|uniref:hemagglutinin repeat-containing protein n=1 Tax=Ralstonia solanacearum TaxID=305 RepID=UPI002F9256FA
MSTEFPREVDSLIGAAGNVTIVARDDVTVHGADVSAGGDLKVTGHNVLLDAGQDAERSHQTESSSQYGQTLAMSGYATVSIGGGSSSSESNAGATLNQGSTLRAGQNVTITATGKDASGKVVDGDIVARGSSISGRNVSLDAARDITLESRQDNTHQDSKNSGSNASIGVGLGVGGNQTGFTLELAAGFNRAHADGDAVTHVNSSVTAADTLTLNAGRDANLRGAQASGNTVNATVGRNLNVESRQDTDNYASRSESGGAQVSLCIPPICYGSAVSGSANVAEGRTDSTYASVVHQSGIAAGTGGYNINVKGNTDLVGGVISSTADPSKNTLRTGTLTTRDVENHAAYSSEQSSISASYTSGNPLNPDGVPTPLQQGVSNLASNAVGNAQGPIAGNASGTTRSAISAGTVVITDNAGQLAKTGKDADATIAGLNRDTAHANDGAIGKIFDKEKVEERQEIARLQAQVVQQVAPLLYKQVGNFLEKQPTEVRVAVHALVGGLLSRAMGGEFAAGAIGAGAATLAVETFGKQLLAIDGLSEGDRKALVQLVGMAVSGVAAGAAGGSSAGVAAAVGTAQSAIQNNYLKHVDRAAYDKAKAACGQSNAKACAEAEIYAEQDRTNNKNLANAVNRCAPGDDCQGVSNFILEQMKAAGCGSNPSSIDCTTLGSAWLAAQSKAQGLETPLIGPDDLIPYKGITSVALAGIRGAGALLARAGLLGMIKRAEPEVVETVVQEIGQEATKKAVQDAGAARTVSGDAQAVNRQATAADTTGGMAHSGDAADALKQGSDNLSSAGTNSIPSSGANAAENSSGRLRAGGTVELFTDASGPKIPGAVGVGPTDPTAIASDAMRMPNIPSGSQARVVANNPFIPPSAGGTSSMMNYLPEAARITQPGGEIVINGNLMNKYFTNRPTLEQLDAMGLAIKYDGPLLSEFGGMKFARTDGSAIDVSSMRSIVFVKKGG